MAFNEMTDGAGLNQIGNRRLGVQAAPFPNVASEIFPVIPLEGPSSPPEYWYLQGGRYCSVFDFAGAAVGERAQVGLRNPVGSGVIAVVESILWSEQSGGVLEGLVRLGNGTPTEDSSLNGWFRDTRLGITSARRSTCLGFSNVAASPDGQGMYTLVNQASSQVIVPGPFILGPGGFVSIEPTTANKACLASFFWRERSATEGELLHAVTS